MHLAGTVTSEQKADVSGSLSLTLADLVWNVGLGALSVPLTHQCG